MRMTYIVFVYCLVTSKVNQSSQMKLKDTAFWFLNTILVLRSNMVIRQLFIQTVWNLQNWTTFCLFFEKII